MGKELQLRHENMVRQQTVYVWLERSQESKLGKKMTNFYNTKFLKKIVDQWNAYKDMKNQQRRNVYHIRQALEARPELARPLKVFRNQLLARAFNKLISGAP